MGDIDAEGKLAGCCKRLYPAGIAELFSYVQRGGNLNKCAACAGKNEERSRRQAAAPDQA